jgi:3,4-dihydroxy 2-butanone 4-phosphate synthase/GTP cyclohydrolase II
VHAGSSLADVFASTPRDGGRHLREAIGMIEAEGRGVIVYLPARGNAAQELEAYGQRKEHTEVPAANDDSPLREFGLGAQVLSDLGVQKLRLLTNNPRKIAGITGFGLQVIERVALSPFA